MEQNNAPKTFLLARLAAAHHNGDGKMPMDALTCFYTSLVLSSLLTGGIIYNPPPKQWKEEGSIPQGIH